MPDTTEHRLKSKVSSLYYQHDHKQREIAKRLHLSRPKVSRLLRRAREEGIVQISVVASDDGLVELETALEEQHGLDEALVVDASAEVAGQQQPPGGGAARASSGADATFLKRRIGEGAARYLRRSTEEGEVLGITWGTTLQAMVQAMHRTEVEGIRVAQALGGVGPPEAEAHAADLSRQLARLLNARLTPLPVPGIVGSAEARETLLADHHVQRAFDFFPQITTAYVGIGALSTNPIFSNNLAVREDTRETLRDAGVVGDIALRFFDADGQGVSSPFEDRLLGITLDQLGEVERVVGVAGGPQKTDAIRGALRGRLVDVLITDRGTAEGLVAA